MDKKYLELFQKAYVNGVAWIKHNKEANYGPVDTDQRSLMKSIDDFDDFYASGTICEAFNDLHFHGGHLFEGDNEIKRGYNPEVYDFFCILSAYPVKIPLHKLVELSYLMGKIDYIRQQCPERKAEGLFKRYHEFDLDNIYNLIDLPSPFAGLLN
jgi:hypothetical protein